MLKLYIESYQSHEPVFKFGSPEFNAHVQQCADKLPAIPNERATEIIDGIIYQISDNNFIDVWVVDSAWGNCKRYYIGSLFEAASMYVDDGGDIDLVTFTDKSGNTYAPIKKRKSVLVTTPEGAEFTVNRGKAENMLRGLK